MYYTEDDSPDKKREEAEANALASNPNLTILRSNIGFGLDSFFIHYLQQSIMCKSIYKSLRSGNYKFAPIHNEDVGLAVNHAFENKNFGKFTLSGTEKLNLTEIFEHLAAQQGIAPSAIKNKQELGGLIDIYDEFWTGLTHTKNMCLFAEHMEKHGSDWQSSDYFT